jgi:hypothetical protein
MVAEDGVEGLGQQLIFIIAISDSSRTANMLVRRVRNGTRHCDSVVNTRLCGISALLLLG